MGRWWGRRRAGKSGGEELPEWAACCGTPERLAAFEAAVRAHFTGRGVEAVVDDGYVHLSDGRRYGLQNLAQVCMLEGEPAWERAIAAHFEAAEQSEERGAELEELLKDYNAVRERLVLRLWRTEDVADMGVPLVAEERAQGLSAVLMLDDEHAAMTVRAEQAGAWGVPLGEVMDQALDNVAALEAETRPVSAAENEPGRLLMIYQGESIYGAAMALRLEHIPGMTGSRGALVSVPVRNVVFSVPIDSMAFVNELGPLINLTRYALQAGPGPVSDRLWWVRDGRWVALPYEIRDSQLHFAPPDEFNRMAAELAEQER